MGGLLLAVLLALPGTATAECGLECERRTAAELIKRGDPRAAVERLKDATRRYPDDRGLVLQLARAYLLEDNLFWAERTLLGAVEKWPDDAGLRAWLAAVHLRQGDPDLVDDDLAPALQPDEDPLRGDARLAFRVFPIRGRDGSTEAGMGFGAAIALDRFWPFVLHAYRHFDDYAAERQPEWAAASGLDRDEFIARLDDPAIREAVVASKKEGLVNGVEETPTLFIDGRRWVGGLELEELVSAVEEAAARARGKLCGSE